MRDDRTGESAILSKSPTTANRRVESSGQTIGDGAGVGKFLSFFRGPARRKRGSAFWDIDAKSLGGPIPAIPTEPLNLPGKKTETKKKLPPKRRPGEIKSPPIRPDINGVPAQPRLRDDVPGGRLRQPTNAGPARTPRRIVEPGVRPPARDGYLATHDLEKSFGGRKVVRGTSLYVRRGEAVGLLGPNGAGKTTVFYMITGLI